MEPRLQLQLRDPERVFASGDLIECQSQIDADDATDIQAVESSILWFTEGKGDDDMSVHYFLRRVTTDVENGDLRGQHEFRALLPNSPLSYSGVILKIRWCARLRVFLKKGRELSIEAPFTLGMVPPGRAVETPQSVSEDVTAGDSVHVADNSKTKGGSSPNEQSPGTAVGF